MKIIFCDDEIEQAKQLAFYCNKYMKERGVKAEILCFDRYHEEIKNADLLILDVEMPQINGLEIKEMLEHENRSP